MIYLVIALHWVVAGLIAAAHQQWPPLITPAVLTVGFYSIRALYWWAGRQHGRGR